MMQDKITRMFQKAEKNEAFRRMLFKKLSETENPYPWFEELSKRGYLNLKNNKNPIIEENYFTVPYWEALGYLENLAKHLAEKPNHSIMTKLLNLIDSIIVYKENGQRIKNPYTDRMIIKTIFKLPIENIVENHIQFIETALLSDFRNITLSAEIKETVFPHLINNKNKQLLLALLTIIIKPKKEKNTLSFENTSIMEEYWFSESLNKYGIKLVEICGLDAAKIIIHQIKGILKEDSESFNIVLVPTIENNPQTQFSEKYECQLVYLIRETLEQATPSSQADLLNELLQNPFSIFKRIGIHIINYHYKSSANLFWSLKGNPLEELGYGAYAKHEIYELLKSNNQYFSNDEFNILAKWIEEIKCKTSETTQEDPESLKKIEARLKLEWLSAVSETDNQRIKELYQKYFKVFPKEIEHPGYLIWSSGVQVSRVGDVKPFLGEILTKSNQEIAEYIVKYKPKEQARASFQLPENFTYSISRTVRENCHKFVTDMLPFLEMKYEYQAAFLLGILDAWKNNEKFSWEELFAYITALISKPDFWSQGEEIGNLYKKLVIGRIGDLIYYGTYKDDRAFDEKYFSECEKILLILGEKTKSELDETTGDILTAVLNSSLGRVYSAMISYSLRFARLLKKDVQQKWTDNIKMHFEKILNNERAIEFDVTLGKFLPQLSFLDKKWVIENINKIFPNENEKSWLNGFSSYLYRSSYFYKDLYCLLRDNQHYRLAMETEFKKSVTSGKVSQHIFIAYLHDLETLSEGSLLHHLIINENTNYLQDLVLFAWRLRDKIDENTKQKIKPLWGKIVAVISASEDEAKYRETLAYLSYWLSLVDEIDEDVCSWLKTSGKYIDEKTEMFFMEYLREHVSRTPQFVAEIFYDLVDSHKYFPRYRKENIVDIVEKLFELEQTEKAKRICNLYLESGHQILREVWNKYKDA